MKIKYILLGLSLLALPLVGKALTYDQIAPLGQGAVLGDATTTDPSAVIDDSPDDTTPPATPSNFTAIPLNAQVSLSWTNPTDADFVRTVVVRKTGTNPSASVTDGTAIYEGTDTSFVDTGLTNGTTYTYSAFSFDAVPNYSAPATATATPDQAKTQVVVTVKVTPPTAGGSSGPAAAVTIRIVKDNGTIYIIQNGQKQGVTNPDMLKSYGLTFADAQTSTDADNQIPQTGILKPQDGSLVKSKEDPTVYLVSGQQRRGFVSEAVFKALGFKFSSVLTVTDPELQALPKAADNLSDTAAAHLPGTDISMNGAIFWVGPDGILHGFPSIDVYDSWRVAGDFSQVVPANGADMARPIGDVVQARIKQ